MIATSQASTDSASAGTDSQTPTASGNLRILNGPGADPAKAGEITARARELFRQAWTLMEQEERSTEESELMINSAHASRYYWEDAGTTANRAIAEWLLSRCYVCLGRAEPALYHAKRCAELSAAPEIDALCRAYAQEALARAYLLGGHTGPAATALEAAERVAGFLPGPDSFYLKQELGALKSFSAQG